MLRELLRREAEIDRRELEDSERQDRREELWRRTNLQAIDGVELAIASIAARELSEAAVQILVAGGYANQVADELDDPRLRELMIRLGRLLRSALPVVAHSAGVDLRTYAAGRYAQGAHDWPFPPTGPNEVSREGSGPVAAEPHAEQREDEAMPSSGRPSSLNLVGPQLKGSEEAAIAGADAAEGADEPRGGPQNEIVMPILDMLFAAAGCSTKHRGQQG